MDMVTSILCVVAASIGKRSNEEIIFLVVVKILSGPSKRTRQSMKKLLVDIPGSTMEDILQGTVVASKELAKVIKELV